ncbi:hypothetical protein AAK938_05055 [Aerococcaceae bacterium 50-4]
MNKRDVNRKGTQDDRSFRNIYKIELSGLLGNNYDELDDNNLKISIKSIPIKILVTLIVAIISFFIFRDGMWSSDMETASLSSLAFIGSTIIVSYIVSILIDLLLGRKRKSK